jgi:YHS domain-containing protein
MRTALCPTCGCALARLGISREAAAIAYHHGDEYLFCCQGCREAFASDAERYLAQIRDVVVCPGCLAEKPAAVMVPLEYQGTVLHFCGCPGCLAAFQEDPERVLARLAV